MPKELLPTREGFILKAQVMSDLVPPCFSGLAMLDKMTESARPIARPTSIQHPSATITTTLAYTATILTSTSYCHQTTTTTSHVIT